MSAHGLYAASDEVPYAEDWAVASFGGTIPAGWSDYAVVNYTCPFNAATVAIMWLVRLTIPPGVYAQVEVGVAGNSTPAVANAPHLSIVDDTPGTYYQHQSDLPMTATWSNVAGGTVIAMRLATYASTTGITLGYAGGFIRAYGGLISS